jgi:hypothetical protein
VPEHEPAANWEVNLWVSEDGSHQVGKGHADTHDDPARARSLHRYTSILFGRILHIVIDHIAMVVFSDAAQYKK